MKIGCMSCSFYGQLFDYNIPKVGNWWGELVGKYHREFGFSELNSLLSHIHNLGFRHLELWQGHAFYMNLNSKEKAMQVLKIASDNDITIDAYCAEVNGENIKETESAFQFANWLGVKVVIGGLRPEGEGLKVVDELCQKYQIYFAHESHHQSPEEQLKIVDKASSWIGINIDTGWFCVKGHDSVEVAELLKDRICHVHLKNMKKNKKGEWECCALNKGEVDIARFVRKLPDALYKGLLSIELETETYDPSDILLESREFVESLCGCSKIKCQDNLEMSLF